MKYLHSPCRWIPSRGNTPISNWKQSSSVVQWLVTWKPAETETWCSYRVEDLYRQQATLKIIASSWNYSRKNDKCKKMNKKINVTKAPVGLFYVCPRWNCFSSCFVKISKVFLVSETPIFPGRRRNSARGAPKEHRARHTQRGWAGSYKIRLLDLPATDFVFSVFILEVSFFSQLCSKKSLQQVVWSIDLIS